MNMTEYVQFFWAVLGMFSSKMIYATIEDDSSQHTYTSKTPH